ncbi:MAG TPA: F0F1 ATP synthase subunit gamma [Sandaracinaceae bacterium]
MAEPTELERIEASLRAVQAVAGVVHAVESLARAQLPRAERAVAEGSEYLDWIDAVIDRLAGPPREPEHAASLTVVVGPERAFSGGLARAVVRSAPARGALGLVGTRLSETAARERGLAERVVFSLAGPSSVDDLADASARLAEAVLAHGSGARVELVHPRGRGVARVVLLAAAREPRPLEHELYSPAREVLRAAVRESVTGRLRIALAEGLLAELRARTAMAERARRAADERLEELEARLRVGQREQITRELTELTTALLALGRPAP